MGVRIGKKELPNQAGNSGKILGTNGVKPSWQAQYTPVSAQGIITENTGNASGDISISGLGFTPRKITFFAQSGSGAGNCNAFGSTTGVGSDKCCYYAATGIPASDNKIWTIDFVSAQYDQSAVLKSFDANGFTYTRTRTNTTTPQDIIILWVAEK